MDYPIVSLPINGSVSTKNFMSGKDSLNDKKLVFLFMNRNFEVYMRF